MNTTIILILIATLQTTPDAPFQHAVIAHPKGFTTPAECEETAEEYLRALSNAPAAVVAKEAFCVPTNLREPEAK